jgi:hypothetical protein
MGKKLTRSPEGELFFITHCQSEFYILKLTAMGHKRPGLLMFCPSGAG